MKRTAKYVGLDVHQATIVVVVRAENGRVIAHTILPTEGAAITEYFRHGVGGRVHVAFEEGTQAQWLYELLLPLVHRVVVCDRRGARRQGNKNDWHDAAELAELLRRDAVRPIYHGTSPHHAELKELERLYVQLVADSTRTMSRRKALYRARAIPTRGRAIYRPEERATWVAQLPAGAPRLRAEALFAELDTILGLRAQAKRALITAARRQPAWAVLRTIPFLGPVRVALLLAVLETPWRFRTKRQLWAYAGFAVTTRSTAEYRFEAGTPVRRRRAPLTRGLNRNHHPLVKAIFKGAATAATGRPGALHDFYQQLLANGLRADLARVTLARKLAALTLRLWKTGEAYDPTKLTQQVS